jgi:hypothetical protein
LTALILLVPVILYFNYAVANVASDCICIRRSEVCGSDGSLYGSDCLLREARCLMQTNIEVMPLEDCIGKYLYHHALLSQRVAIVKTPRRVHSYAHILLFVRVRSMPDELDESRL